MATNRLIQYLETTAYSAYPGGADVAIGSDVMNRGEYEQFWVAPSTSASTTLTLAPGDIVCFDFIDGGAGEVVVNVKKSAADGACIGVCLDDGTSETDGSVETIQQSKVRVQLAGLCEAKVKGANNAGNAAISSGDYLCQSDAAGVLYKFTAGTDALPVAIAVDDVASGAAAASKTVIWLKQF